MERGACLSLIWLSSFLSTPTFLILGHRPTKRNVAKLAKCMMHFPSFGICVLVHKIDNLMFIANAKYN